MRAEAVILAGGKGQRLMPYTRVLPKPLLPIGDTPILEIILRQLRAQGFRRVILAVNRLHRLIWSYFGDGHELGIELVYNVEDEPLGTCGAIAMCLDLLEDDFLVMNGDVLTALNYRAMLDRHCAAAAALTVAVREEETRIEFGVVDRADDGRVLGIREKPTSVHVINTGIYALNRESVRGLLGGVRFLDMPDVMTSLISEGRTVRSYELAEAWIDIGRPQQYEEAQELFKRQRQLFLAPEPAAAQE